MNPAPLVSVILPVKNAAATLGAALDSVLSQRYENVELVGVDGGSTDGSLELLRESAAGASRLRVIEGPDAGVYDGMNRALGQAKGEWVIFLGADDALTCDLGQIVPLLGDAGAVHYGDVTFKRSGKRYAGRFNAFRLMRRNICHQAIFYPRAVFERYRFDLRYPVLADWHLNVRLWQDGVRFKRIDRVIARFDEIGASGTKRDDAFQSDRLKLMIGLAASTLRRRN